MPKETLQEKMPQQSLQDEIFYVPQITDREAQQMRTYLKIPTEIKSLDPDWIKKAFSGQKLTQEEKYQYAFWKYQQKVKKLKKLLKAPSKGTFERVRFENHVVRNHCEIGDSGEGWNT